MQLAPVLGQPRGQELTDARHITSDGRMPGGPSPSVAVVPSPLMPAAVYVGDGRIAVERVPCPVPGPGEVLVEIAECGICGSDLHMVLEQYAKVGCHPGPQSSGIVAAAPCPVAPAGLPATGWWGTQQQGAASADPVDGAALRCA